VRGPGGGYRLSRDADEIHVAQIIDSVNESVDATNCGGKGNCQAGEVCLTHTLWQELSGEIHHFLSNISLQKLVDRNDVRSVADRQLAGFNQKTATIPLTAVQ
jgi:Rrf2 family iron-sulfur cluster assembly transcriptional regulator